MTELEQRVHDVLVAAADDAPAAVGLAEAARRRARGRRRTLAAGVASVAVAAVVVPLALVLGGDGRTAGPVVPDPGSSDTVEPVPDGWRTVTAMGLTVQVPDTWDYGARSSWCTDAGRADVPVVELPGQPVRHIKCGDPEYSWGLTLGSWAAISPVYPSGHVWQYEKGEVEMYADGSWLGYWYDDEERMVSVNAGDRQTVQRIIDSVAQADDGWGTVEHGGVTVDLPPGWDELDQSGCRWPWPRFGPESSDPCEPDAEGFTFYGSATFDPAHGPGARRSGEGWTGYVFAGDYAVSINSADQEVVQRVLDSAEPAR